MGGETQRDGGELSDTLLASACSAVPPETSKPQQLLLMSCTESYSLRGQREHRRCSWAQTPRSGRWTDGSCKRTVHDWGDQARKSLECGAPDLWPRKWQSSPTVRIKCGDFYKTRGRRRSYKSNLFRGRYSADFISTVSQGGQGNIISFCQEPILSF